MWEYFEEYRNCGCVSAVVDDIKDLPGYCAVHGTDRSKLHKLWHIPETKIKKGFSRFPKHE